MSELCQRVIVENYELIGITETCVTESVNDAELSIDGYSMFRKDRGTRGGGLILYIKNTIRARVNKELTSSKFAESLWCNVEIDHQRLLVGLCYIRPTSTVENDEELLSVTEKAVLQTTAHHVLIMGDFLISRKLTMLLITRLAAIQHRLHCFSPRHKNYACFSM